ncbi:MAG TPA: hypothetical protein VJL59_00715 [Anaerolineales bacterium]|nr:hypothetical protein [Anaerolineales bacterium]HLB45521.1 hypothetical protein [Anaerolineales bacterium]
MIKSPAAPNSYAVLWGYWPFGRKCAVNSPFVVSPQLNCSDDNTLGQGEAASPDAASPYRTVRSRGANFSTLAANGVQLAAAFLLFIPFAASHTGSHRFGQSVDQLLFLGVGEAGIRMRQQVSDGRHPVFLFSSTCAHAVVAALTDFHSRHLVEESDVGLSVCGVRLMARYAGRRILRIELLPL